MKKVNWSGFIHKTKDLPPRKLLLKALKHVTSYESALDFGAGGLRDTKALIEANFKHIDILDSSTKTKTLASKLDKKTTNVQCYITEFAKFNYQKDFYSLINAQYALPFVDKDQEKNMLEKLFSSLASRGLIVGQFFGENDSWNDGNNPNIIFHTEQEVQKLLEPLNIVYFNEKEFVDNKSDVHKNWHVFEFIAKKVDKDNVN